ncbi:MAG: hypothetical protein IPI24_01675 [Ignavibacteria bacterium]|nr:hypothetical protein [Ignavibacteria bacterium]
MRNYDQRRIGCGGAGVINGLSIFFLATGAVAFLGTGFTAGFAVGFATGFPAGLATGFAIGFVIDFVAGFAAGVN